MSNESKTMEKEAQAQTAAKQPWTAKRVGDLLLNNALIIIMVIAVIYIAVINENFLKAASVINIISQTAAYLPAALGIGGCIVLTGTDLSAGRAVGLTACVSASLLQNAANLANKMWPEIGTLPIPVVIVISMIIGALIGCFNGFFVAKFKLHPFIVTLGTQLILYTFLLLYVQQGNNKGMAISNLDASYTGFVKGSLFSIRGTPIPNYVLFAVVLTAVMWFVWNKTTFGKNMFALGSNEEAARVSGVNVFATTIAVFALAGAMYGFTGFIEGARIGSNTANTGLNYELDAIAACVIGGVSFVGGIGKIRGIVIGVLMLRLIFVGLTMVGVPQDLQYLIKGAIILFACALDMRKYLVKK
ncbi:ABC transporter permease subunit [uncultured Oscillibacter sp.]|uniref:galactose/methyl galactoside ABC transporter permease MglC n=1 Tax=uncultured Oscillibacter sp. TaxID=876091 RepID=UPI0025D30F6C|nr:beta-methylgalactoside transporter [uncultured Oscillibacter sp.]